MVSASWSLPSDAQEEYTRIIQAEVRHIKDESMLYVIRAAEVCSTSGDRRYGDRQSHLGRADARGWGAQHGVQHALLLGIVQAAAQSRQTQDVRQRLHMTITAMAPGMGATRSSTPARATACLHQLQAQTSQKINALLPAGA